MISADEIRDIISAGMPDAQVRVMGDDGQHFEAEVISPAFVGQSIVAQHRMVYAALGDRMGREIHALALRTRVPEQNDG